VDKLGDAIGEAVNATVKDPEEFWAFLQRLTKDNAQAADLIHKFLSLADLKADGEFGEAVAAHVGDRLEKFRQDIGDIKSRDRKTPDAFVFFRLRLRLAVKRGRLRLAVKRGVTSPQTPSPSACR
jgi:hypothetical protein